MDQVCPKRLFPVKNGKTEHHHWILDTGISVVIRFHHKLRILILDEICLKIVFPVKNGKIALVRASMVVTYYVKLFRTGANRHSGILMSLLLLVSEAIIATLCAIIKWSFAHPQHIDPNKLKNCNRLLNNGTFYDYDFSLITPPAQFSMFFFPRNTLYLTRINVNVCYASVDIFILGVFYVSSLNFFLLPGLLRRCYHAARIFVSLLDS